MKRFLTLEEEKFLITALEYYQEHGPKHTVVKKVNREIFESEVSAKLMEYGVELITFGDKDVYVPQIIEVIEESPRGGKAKRPELQPEEDYYAMAKAYFGDQYDDEYDVLALVSALTRFTQEITRDIRKWIADR